ncbi:cytosolic carboxypeptidase-like protein 5 isoform X2 [Octopus sinensis]|uniref:Cytosolic carboxypeptidase-like protein 5 isoform X2 n=1 Tax=Octopus sinensis TaxID=2607531 RepID=A0A6P7SQY4_9MOLL|nr:cytosolic carboxypeptidase-like protein 5 isoform X2 [Octopus sinensis]
MEVSVGGLLFKSNFDSGNLAKVERVYKDDTKDSSSVSNNVNRNAELQPDLEYNVWTRPDCSNTIYENGNRSWFYFGIEGGLPGQMIKINIMNMNRQGKLYSQGYCPVIYTVPGSNKWERLQEKPVFDTIDGQFILSFCYRFTEIKGATTYFAFAYPHSYIECQNNINELEERYSYCKNISSVENIAEDTVYFYRELLCYSLEKLEVSLITVSSFHNIIDEEEPHFDPKLFPIKNQPRCKKFKEKKVFVVTSRVHPGETPSSFVFNGFLNFILRLDDPRSIQLRKQFVFKLIPILNPDGVMNGHYRTDTRGVNLNRVYGDPSFELNPSIYAAKSIIIYYHVNYRLKKDMYKDIKFPPTDILPKQTDTPSTTSNTSTTKTIDTNSIIKFPEITNIGLCQITQSLHATRSGLSHRELNYKACLLASRYKCRNLYDGDLPKRPHSFSTYDRMTQNKLNVCNSPAVKSINQCSQTSGSRSDSEDSSDPKGIKNGSLNKEYSAKTEEQTQVIDSELTMHLESLRISNGANSDITQTEACRIHSESVECNCKSDEERTNSRNDGSDEDHDRYQTLPPSNVPSSAHLNNSAFRRILPQHSGIAFYIDLHGHASRKGCFIYGNFLEADDSQIQNMLYPKLVSLNSAHFEFDACNFSQRNMYIRDKRDGLSKEGSGRVAIHKCTGIIHSYTLECNYNTGKVMNAIPPAYGDKGRASPTSIVGIPPKYTPSIYEDVGQAIAVAALDMYETNPWSRVTLSEYKSLYGTREWLRKYCLIPKGFLRPKNYKPPLRTHSFSHFSSSRNKINSNDTISLNSLSTTSETVPKNLNSGKKELRPLKDVSSRLTSCSRKCNVGNNKKEEESTISETKVSGSFTLPNSTESPGLASLRSTRLQHNKINPISYNVCSESVPKHTTKFTSRNKPIDSKLQRAKSDISKSTSISPAIFSKPVKSNSLYDKKDAVKTGLSRSVSSGNDKQRSLLHLNHNHTWSAEGSFHNNKLMFKSRRHMSSSTSMQRKKSELARVEGSLSSVHLKSKEEFSSEATNDVQRNMPPKKKRKYSLFKKKPAVNSLRSNTISRNHLKTERRDSTAHEKFPHKRKVSWRILPHSTSQQFTKTNSNYRCSIAKAATFQSFVNLPFSNVNRLPFQIEGCSLRNCSKSAKEPEVPS